MKAQEIIDALECCNTSDRACEKCPYREKGCFSALHKDTLFYIYLLKQDKATAQAKARVKQRSK